MASPLPPEDDTPFAQGMAAMSPEDQQMVMSGLEAAKNFDLAAYQAQYQKAQAAQDAALKAAQATGLSDQYTQLYGGADIIPGMTQGILSNLGIENPYLPVYTLRGTANKGEMSANERMSFAPLPGMDYRLVDKNTGQVMTASTPEEIKALAEAANALGKSGGPMANYAIESGQGGNYSTMYEDRPDISKFDRLAGMALPVAVSLIPGLQGVGAVLAGTGAGAAGSAIAGGDPLKGALMGGLTAAGTQFLGPVVQSAPNAAGNVVATNLGRAVGAGAGATAGGIVTGQPIEKALMGGALAGGTTYLGGELFGGEDTLANKVAANNRLALSNLDANIYNAGFDIGSVLAPYAPGQGAFAPPGSPAVTPWAAGKVPSYSTGATPASDYTATARVPGTFNPVFTATLPPATTAGPNLAVTGTRTQQTPPNFTVVPAATTTGPETIVTGERVNKNETNPTLAVIPAATTTGPETVVTGKRVTEETKPTVTMPPATTTGPETVVTGKRETTTTEKPTATPVVGATTAPGDIVVTAKKPAEPTGPTMVLTVPGVKPLPQDIVDLAEKDTTGDKSKLDAKKVLAAAALLSAIGGSGGGGGTGGTPGSQKLQSIFSAKLPKPGEGGAFQVGGLGPRTAGPGGTFSARPTTDWYRYGMGPAMDIPAGTDLSLATSPYAGYGPGTLGAENFRRVSGAYSPLAVRRELMPNMVSSLGRDATSGEIETALTGAKTAEEARRINPGTAYFDIDAGTAQALGDPSLVGTVMSIQDLQRRMAARPMAHGGSMGYARGSSRKSFAVEGPGTGRSDDIPAVLSDGEYVLDAETVALLGDGSSKAGAKKLDEMRVRLRKHKGRNLAKGKFSVNAKRPEKYLSGGRT